LAACDNAIVILLGGMFGGFLLAKTQPGAESKKPGRRIPQ